jgi:hypothetical protein
MADIVRLAQVFYDSACGNAAQRAALRTHRDELLSAVASGATSGTIITASKNGASYTTRIDVTSMDRLNALNMAVQGLDAGRRPSRTYHARFLQTPSL